MERFQTWLDSLGGTPDLRAALLIGTAIVVAAFVRLLFARVFLALSRRTATDVDDRIALALRGPVASTIVLAAVWVAITGMTLSQSASYVLRGVLVSSIAAVWAVAGMRVGSAVLDVISRRVDRLPWVQPKTLPLFEMLLKIAVVGGLLYFICVAWSIPLTSWLASAGIIGIAVGFAAKDTLANLFSGVFIIADAPYKVGDFIVLDNDLRGIVSDIGIRSTRLLTRDDIEVTVPNAVIGASRIVNETGGPNDRMRVRVKVAAAYGSDVDEVERVLLASVEGVEHVSPQPTPRVRLREFGDSGLIFELLAWIDEPVHRGRVLHQLNRNVYKGFASAGIEIPYSKLDVYLKGQQGTAPSPIGYLPQSGR